MSYYGYIPSLQQMLTTMKRSPAVLEVGIDRGVTLIPLTVAMATVHEAYVYIGIDVQVQDSVKLILGNLGHRVANNTMLIQDNSMNVLPQMVSQGLKFDVVLLDGDHNYHTVKNELQYIEALTSEQSIVIIDDYDGRWSTRDLWYAERDGYQDNALTTKPVETEQHGVKPAVDEWLVEHPGWAVGKPIQGEPIVLMRKKQEDGQRQS